MKSAQGFKDDPGARDEVVRHISGDILGGFYSKEEILDRAVALRSEEYDPAEVRPFATRYLEEFSAQQARKQISWPKETDCDLLDRAFAELGSAGIICRQNFSCCGTCGAGDLSRELTRLQESGSPVRGYVFYHTQDTPLAVEGYGLFLDYDASAPEDSAALRIGHEICGTLHRNGLQTLWDGTLETRIKITMDWKRRRRPSCTR